MKQEIICFAPAPVHSVSGRFSSQPMLNDTLAEALVAYFDVCLMIRVHLKPLEIAKLKTCAPSYISNIRKSLLLKIFGIEGSSELFDDEIGKIGRKDTR